MYIIQIVFWIFIGLLYLGITFQFQSIVIGICALVIGISMLIDALKR